MHTKDTVKIQNSKDYENYVINCKIEYETWKIIDGYDEQNQLLELQNVSEVKSMG